MNLRLPVILVLFFGLVFHAFSDVGDVYFCETTQLMKINADSSYESFKNEKFKFKREQNTIIFGDEDSIFQGVEIDITRQKADEIFVGHQDAFSLISYDKGKFYYSSIFIWEGEITAITASCSTF